ncbi:MAG TPA: hypothetical protein VK961_19565, partial [Chthoniobacter sp.]|nr:hypothetical protein [Chthoniobacter sp.]
MNVFLRLNYGRQEGDRFGNITIVNVFGKTLDGLQDLLFDSHLAKHSGNFRFSQVRLNVEPELHHVAVFHHVFLA